MKTIIKSTLLLLVCTLAGQAMAQSVQIGSASGNPGETVSIPVTFTAGPTPARDVTAITIILGFTETYDLVAPTGVAAPLCGGDVAPLSAELCGWGAPGSPQAYQINQVKAGAFPSAVIARISYTIPAAAAPGTVDDVIATRSLIGGASGALDPAVEVLPGTITVDKIDQTISAITADPVIPVIGQTSTLSATATSGLAVTFGSATLGTCTVAGNIVSYITAGLCTVTADQAGDATYNAAPQVTLDITGEPLDQTITGFAAAPDPGVVDGTSTLSATASSGLPVTFGSNTMAVCTVSASTVTYLAAGTCTVTGDQAGNAAYNPATQVTLNITVNKKDQVISGLAADPATGIVDGTSTLSATVDSGLAATFGSSTPAVCTVAGNIATYLTAGTCTVTADQAGDANYNAATQVTINVTVNPADQTITGLAADPAGGQAGGTSALSATASSGLAVTFASSTAPICTVSGSTVTYIAVGTCNITADQAGDANYNAAPQVSIDITVAMGDQVITDFMSNPPVGAIGLSATLSAMGGASGNPVTFGSLTPDVCTVSGDSVTFVLNGLCTVSADQEGDDNYNAATQATLLISVAATTIPTLSQWGLIALMLLMLSIGSIVIRRRTIS